jgi:hypothetical protein
MKPILLLAAALASYFITPAQNLHSDKGFRISYKVLDTLNLSDTTDLSMHIPYNVPIKAVRDFYLHHSSAGNITWSAIKDGFMVYFTENAIENRVGYNHKGNCLYRFRSYPDSLLPEKIRREVTTSYPGDYTIAWINEVEVQRIFCYFIYLEGRTSWIKLRFCEGEMEVVEQWNKQ